MRQHIAFNLRIKGALRRAAPALDAQIEPTQNSTEAFFRAYWPSVFTLYLLHRRRRSFAVSGELIFKIEMVIS
jgi:hypothetical protein